MKTSLFTQIIHFLLILFFTSENLYASNVVRYISNINGLTNNSVNCILEDSEKYNVDRNMGWTECVQWERNHNV